MLARKYVCILLNSEFLIMVSFWYSYDFGCLPHTVILHIPPAVRNAHSLDTDSRPLAVVVKANRGTSLCTKWYRRGNSRCCPNGDTPFPAASPPRNLSPYGKGYRDLHTAKIANKQAQTELARSLPSVSDLSKSPDLGHRIAVRPSTSPLILKSHTS